MGRYLQYPAIVFLLVSSVAWAIEHRNFMENASPHATKACAGKTGFFDGRNSYYWCLRHVEAGGKP